MIKLASLLLIIVKCAISQNVETRTYHKLSPTNLNERSFQFGATLIAIRSGSETTITAGAPSYGQLQQDEGRGNKGAVFTCPFNVTQGPFVQCTTVSEFEREGGIGISLGVAVAQNSYVVCGNTYTFNCPDNNQRWIGACFKKSLLDDSRPQLLSSPCASVCPGVIKADIIFVLDESGSVDDRELNQERQWVINVLESFSNDINNGYVHLGLFSFADSTTQRIRLGEISFDDFRRRVYFPRTHGSTYIAQAINDVAAHFKEYGRSGVPKQIIILTDGQANDTPLVESAARTARNNGIITMVVGVGLSSSNQLLQIAGTMDRVFTATDFSNLENVVEGLREEITEAASISLEGEASNSTNSYLQCGQGISTHINRDNNVYTGAVGSYDRSGSVFDYVSNTGDIQTTYTKTLNDSQIEDIINPENLTSITDSYLGYSITSGNFYGGSTEYIASGSPRYMSKGRVIIYQQENPTIEFAKIQPPDNLWQLGGYFGQTVLAVDLNKDSYDDLLVSAPLYNDNVGYDQGRVFVYLNNPTNPANWNEPTYQPQILMGLNAIGARFGMSITVVGDVDQNGFNDVIIGAPNEELNENSSGSTYLYYVSENGISDNRKQRIVGSSITASLKHFGFAANGGNSMNLDVDLNGYPDIVVSAPSSDSIVVLRSRPIIDINAEIIFEQNSINLIKCLGESLLPCLKFKTCIQAISRVELPEEIFYGMNLTVSLDINTLKNQRVRFFETTQVSKNFAIEIGTQQICLNHSLELNLDTSVYSLLSLQLPIVVSLEYNFNGTHKSQNLSAVLDPVTPNFVTNSLSFDKNCNGQDNTCQNDLSITATYSVPQEENPYIIGKNPGLFSIDYTIQNNGPDYSFFPKINVTSSALMLTQVRGSCVEQSLTESSATTTVLFYKSSVTNLQTVMNNGATCNFQLDFSLEGLTIKATTKEIEITAKVFSSAEATSETNDQNLLNNEVEYKRKLLYSVVLQLGGSSVPTSLYYNRTTSVTTIRTLNNQALGGNYTNIIHKHTIYNQGPNLIYTAPLTFTWPKQTLQGFPLLYLQEFSCEPKSVCQCSVGNKVNSLNFPITENNTNYTIDYPSKESLNLPPKTTCEDVICESINCQINRLLPYQSIVVPALYKLWLPSLAQSKLNTILTSTVTMTANLPLYPDNINYKSTLETSIAEYEPPIVVQPKKGLNLGAIIGAIVGGLVALIVLVVILWKKGFFKSKYAEKIREAEEEIEREDI